MHGLCMANYALVSRGIRVKMKFHLLCTTRGYNTQVLINSTGVRISYICVFFFQDIVLIPAVTLKIWSLIILWDPKKFTS